MTQAILFDVFGTVVDWRSSLIAQFRALSAELGRELPGETLADQWRSHYAPSMDRVRKGEIPWTALDDLHRASLRVLLEQHGLDLDEPWVERVNRFWHRLDPWPDTVPGLRQLKERFVIGSLTNGNLALMVDVARHAGLPWDVLFCADIFQHYKPDPDVYLGACRLLRLAPADVMLCAAHNYDLRAAKGLGLKTAFVCRPTEYGPTQSTDLAAEEDWDIVADDFVDLSHKLASAR